MKQPKKSIRASAEKDHTGMRLPEYGDCPFISALIAKGIITIRSEKKTGQRNTQK